MIDCLPPSLALDAQDVCFSDLIISLYEMSRHFSPYTPSIRSFILAYLNKGSATFSSFMILQSVSTVMFVPLAPWRTQILTFTFRIHNNTYWSWGTTACFSTTTRVNSAGGFPGKCKWARDTTEAGRACLLVKGHRSLTEFQPNLRMNVILST